MLGLEHPDVFQSFADNGLASRGHLIEQNLVINCNCQLGSLQRKYKDRFLDDCQDWTFRNNLFINISSKLDVDFLNMKFYNNTFYNCMTNSPRTAQRSSAASSTPSPREPPSDRHRTSRSRRGRRNSRERWPSSTLAARLKTAAGESTAYLPGPA